MHRFKIATAQSFEESDAALFGIPTDLGAKSERKGRREAPRRLREISSFLYDPEQGEMRRRLWDMGDIAQSSRDITANLSKISDTVEAIAKKGKRFIAIGGDCSIKHGVVRGLSRIGKRIGIVYFDSHPDFVKAATPYYGSVMADNIATSNVDPKRCVIVGARNMESREKTAMKAAGVRCISALDVMEMGIEKTSKEVISILSRADIVLLSIDLDVLDPAFAPGVGVPCPGGLSSSDLLRMLARLKRLKQVAGMDITEYIPKFDVQEMTGQIACRLIQEFCAE